MATCVGGSRSDTCAQPFPKTGRLRETLSTDLTILRRLLAKEKADVHRYVVASICYEGARFVQTGSGPNFQGGMITLCTCKHQMRSWYSVDEWPGRWISGFTSINAVNRGHYLVYLMKVSEAYSSHLELWSSPTIRRSVKLAKAADAHRLGDVFQPRSALRDPFDFGTYHPPRRDHSHAEKAQWHRDIDYGSNRPAALLIGDTAFSFLWDRPMLLLRDPTPPKALPRNPGLVNIHDMIENLQPVNCK